MAAPKQAIVLPPAELLMNARVSLTKQPGAPGKMASDREKILISHPPNHQKSSPIVLPPNLRWRTNRRSIDGTPPAHVYGDVHMTNTQTLTDVCVLGSNSQLRQHDIRGSYSEKNKGTTDEGQKMARQSIN